MEDTRVYCNECDNQLRIKMRCWINTGICKHPNSKHTAYSPYKKEEHYHTGEFRNANNDCKDFEPRRILKGWERIKFELFRFSYPS